MACLKFTKIFGISSLKCGRGRSVRLISTNISSAKGLNGISRNDDDLRKDGGTRTLTTSKTKDGLAKYGGRHTVTMLPGHGIGPEMMEHVKDVFKFAGAPVDFEVINMSADRDDEDELHMAITSIKRNGVAIKGNIETRVNRPNMKSRNVDLRQHLNLYASVLHCYSFPGINVRHNNIDIVVVRQNTEGEYSMLENESVPGVVESLKIMTTENSIKLAQYAFDYAKKHNRKKVTAIHKANIMKVSDGLFLDCCREVAKDHPEIEFNSMIIDNCCMQLVAKPEQFDVMITTNLYGTIVSNVICGMVGGAGLLSGANYGEKYAVFEPGTRNTGSSIAGRNIANPTAMLNAGADLLSHLKLGYHAHLIRDSISKTLNEDKIFTSDLGGTATSQDVVQNVMKNIQLKTLI
ncbi:hypothetical protein CHUAL_002260 [Chamberlinius hualienensis]